MNAITFAFSLASFAWTLLSQNGLDTQNVQVTLNVHANGTSNEINFSGPLPCSWTIKQNVVGHTTDEPGWAAWLTPLQIYEDTTNVNYPLSGSVAIPAGQAYYVYHSYKLETGNQTWIDSGSLSASLLGTPALLPPFAVRTRYWMKNSRVWTAVE